MGFGKVPMRQHDRLTGQHEMGVGNVTRDEIEQDGLEFRGQVPIGVGSEAGQIRQSEGGHLRAEGGRGWGDQEDARVQAEVI